MQLLSISTAGFTVISSGLCALLLQFSPVLAAQAPIKSPEVTPTGKGHRLRGDFSLREPDGDESADPGRMVFRAPLRATQIAATPERPEIRNKGLLLTAWKSGDVPLANRNPGGPWPIADMQKEADGVWTFTTPPTSVSVGLEVQCYFPCSTSPPNMVVVTPSMTGLRSVPSLQ
jgi:hypothetical protein